MRSYLLAGLAVLSLAAPPASAQAPKSLGSFEKWSALSYQEQGKPVCYLAGQPTESKGGPPKRGDIFLMITHRPGQKATDVISFVAGYELKGGSEVEAAVGGLGMYGGAAWNTSLLIDRPSVEGGATAGANSRPAIDPLCTARRCLAISAALAGRRSRSLSSARISRVRTVPGIIDGVPTASPSGVACRIASTMAVFERPSNARRPVIIS